MRSVLEIQAALKAQGFDPGPVDGLPGARTTAALAAFQKARGLDVDGIAGTDTLAALFPAPAAQPGASPLTAEVIRAICPAAKPAIVSGLLAGRGKIEAAGIRGRRLAHFLSQIATETLGLTKLEENLNYTTAQRIYEVFKGPASKPRFRSPGECAPLVKNPRALANKVYGGRLGNVGPDDGWNFRGGGYLHTTGRENYAAAGFEHNPDALRDPEAGLDAAITFWVDNGLNKLADSNNVEAVSRRVNGGTNGLADRKAFFAKASRALGL